MTGASGFIGRHICEFLDSQDHEVWELLYKPTEGLGFVFCCELRGEPLPNGLMEGVAGVFHLANVAHTDLKGKKAGLYWQVNVEGTEALLRAAVEATSGACMLAKQVKR